MKSQPMCTASDVVNSFRGCFGSSWLRICWVRLALVLNLLKLQFASVGNQDLHAVGRLITDEDRLMVDWWSTDGRLQIERRREDSTLNHFRTVNWIAFSEIRSHSITVQLLRIFSLFWLSGSLWTINTTHTLYFHTSNEHRIFTPVCWWWGLAARII